jgi:hypothetical protein
MLTQKPLPPRGIQVNVFATDAFAAELKADARELTTASGQWHTRQDVLKIAHRFWKESRIAKAGR